MRKLRILMVTPVIETVPPEKYGGVELVASNLTEALVREGHEVTLFAPRGSKSKAKLIVNAPEPMRGKPIEAVRLLEFLQAVRTLHMAHEFDLVHFHFGPETMPFGHMAAFHLFGIPVVFTLHGRMDTPQTKAFFGVNEVYKKVNLVSISNDQRSAIPDLHYAATVYNGIDVAHFPFGESAEDYLMFVGRVCDEKGAREAIEIAKQSNHKLHIFAKVDPVDRDYFSKQIEPLIDGEQIIFHGETTAEKRLSYWNKAKATLFPIKWKEPFGLVMIESMACGTPVIAARRASVPEIINDGVTGVLVDPDRLVEDSLKALERIGQIDRRACRAHVEEHFTIEAMAKGYLEVYQKLLARS